MRPLSHTQATKQVDTQIIDGRPHWQCDRCGIVGCDIPRRIRKAIKNWTKDNQNKGVLGWINNQAPIVGPAWERRHARTTSEGTSAKNEVNFCSCN
jgi:hypothetical protein